MNARGRWHSCAATTLLLMASGCLIVPKTKKTEQRRYVHTSAMKPVGQPVPEVSVRPNGPALEVEAHWRRTCAVWHSEIIEYRMKRTAGLASWGSGNLGGCGPCLAVVVVVLLAAPITMTVSGIATAIVVSGDDPPPRREVASQTPQRLTCDAPGDQFRVRATSHGRPPIEATTNAEGRARIPLPPGAAIYPITVYTVAPDGVPPVILNLGPPGAGASR